MQLLNQSREQSDQLKQHLELLQRPNVPRVDMNEQELRDRKQLKRQLRARYKQLMKRIEVLKAIQATIDRQYASLRDVCVEKRQRLEELLALNVVYEEIVDLETWMHQQATIAAASTTGRDLSECLNLVNQFSQFSNDVLGIKLRSLTHSEGAQTSIEKEANALIPEVDEESTLGFAGGAFRMARVINMYCCLIRTRHSDAPQIAFWKGRLTETWAGLNELIRTRWVQLIYAVQMINRTAEQLLPLYAGKWTVRLTKPRDNLIGLMNELRTRMQRRRKRLEEAITLHRWLTTVNEIVRWIQNTRTEVDHMLCPEENSEITRAEIGYMWFVMVTRF
ncbi:Spectrin beta chain brain 1 [Fasciola gigantica]|uniref:Spectrin beta chain brain 1 n=1 Tax=Fasciola gigantica TaxID=46835 RepID=A0A504YIR6_FASGI|nr:Spectrin beta chain brain 1 [Fasciola gigantica]